MKIAKNVGFLVGNTPIVRLSNLDKELYGEIYAKCEFMIVLSWISFQILTIL
ncbi:MAG: hypothetical protein HY307_02130 [Arcobacter sp.]|nr:hypothetical protein [Arcobacter sp.]